MEEKGSEKVIRRKDRRYIKSLQKKFTIWWSVVLLTQSEINFNVSFLTTLILLINGCFITISPFTAIAALIFSLITYKTQAELRLLYCIEKLIYKSHLKNYDLLPYKHSTYLSIFFLTVSRMDVQELCRPWRLFLKCWRVV